MRWNYHLKVLLSQYRRTLMTLGKLRFSDISFSTYSKHQMIMYQLKWLSRSQETLGKYQIQHCLNIFAYCKKCRGLRFIQCLYSHWIIFLRLNYYLLHTTTKVESMYQCMLLQKIILSSSTYNRSRHREVI